jgi:hypothetical protein
MADDPSGTGVRISSHILPTAGTMLGICTTLIGLVKLHETRSGPSRVDEHAGLIAIFFLLSALTSYLSIRNLRHVRTSRALERAADTFFVLGLFGLAVLSLFFAWEIV